MKYAEIIAAIQGSELENKAQIVSALDDHVNGITTEANSQQEKLQAEIEAVLEAAATGEGNLTQRVKSLVDMVEKMSSEKEQLATQVSEWESKYQGLERSSTIKEAARMAGLKTEAALSEILKPEDNLEIKDEKVLVNGKEYQKWVEEDKSAFAASLLPSNTIENTLPSGGANPKNSTTPELKGVDIYRKSHTWGAK